MEGRRLFAFLGAAVLGIMFIAGCSIGSAARSNGSVTPTKVASAPIYASPTPTPTATMPSVVGQPVSWFWYQLPADVQQAILNQMNRVPTPAPSDRIDFEVGKNGCRFTVEKNATERLTGSLTDDCAELLRILNPVPPAPPATPSPTYYQKDLEDPREGKYARIRVYVDYGQQTASFMHETEPGSYIWVEAKRMTNYVIQANAEAQITREGDIYAVEIAYYDGSVAQRDNFSLDELFPLPTLPPESAPEPTATPTVTPTPEKHIGDGPFIWVANAGGLGLFLTARVDENTMASVFSLREFTPGGTLLVDDWFVTSPVFEFRGAEMMDDGYVLIRYGTSAQGGDIMIRHQPWFR